MTQKLPRFYTLLIGGISIIALFVSSWFLAQKQEAISAEIEVYDSEPINIFGDYLSWHSSKTLKTTDMLGQALFAMGSKEDYRTPQSAFDINGDGLVDIVSHVRQSDYSRSELGVFLNKGNMQFDVAYKCVIDRFGGIVYYGDCAQ
ncbi:MAG: hypothetical protein A3E05_03875 [Candidatus Jacksonbacteria bacterium RIFCSPHIGHO2_12_FULL_44_12]|nr:MAG: hypothetical protein A3E05_03875 [Candidatus Jacksonbacteria bacterium RIFCSPHIGHO2_12_FULL_44_12]